MSSITDVSLLHIGNFSYRCRTLYNNSKSASTSATTNSVGETFDSDDDDVEDKSLNVDFAGLKLEKDGNQFVLKFQLDIAYHRFLIGAKGKTKKRLEAESNAQLVVPPQKSKRTDLAIRAKSSDAVGAMKVKIDSILEEKARTENNLPYTHFLSIPVDVQGGAVSTWLAEMRAQHHDTSGFHESMLMDPKRHHMTMLMLRLPTQTMINKACDLMQDLSQQVYDAVDTRSLVVRFEGLSSFQKNPYEVSNLHMKPYFEGDAKVRMERMTRLLIDQFKKHKLAAVSESDTVKWHVTVLNSRYVDPKVRKTIAKTLDASEILANYMDFEFGMCRLGSIHLSKRFEDDANGYYKKEGQILLPCNQNERLK